MAGRLEGKVALITGAARGQGRSHAIRLAEEGADIVAVDICRPIASVPYPLATAADLDATAAAVEALGRRVLTYQADVRDGERLEQVVAAAVEELGRLDVVSANAGIFSVGRCEELTEESWRDMIDVTLTGSWLTAKAAIPHLRRHGRGGSIVFTSSFNGAVGAPMYSHYVAAKHGVIGLMRALAMELAPDLIRVNAILPGGVRTDMVRDFHDIGTNDVVYRRDAEPVSWFDQLIEPIDISNAVVFLASDEARFVTGVGFPVDGMALVEPTRALS